MNILLVYPKTPPTFWSYHWALDFISKKAALPPLGLVTIASMLPGDWEKKVIDLNIAPLDDREILWADMVFLTGMNVHAASMQHIISRCKEKNRTIVGGGPLLTVDYESFPEIDHYILGEAEEILPLFLQDLSDGFPKRFYRADIYPDITKTPAPAWELLDLKKYATLSIQYSRGCPYDCEFCSITMMNGRKPRQKTSTQFISELEKMYRLGWKGDIFVVDDNIAGNRRILKHELLPAIIEWLESHGYPFTFTTEISIDTSDDDELVDLLARAQFSTVFVGIETPDTDSLAGCGKRQNCNRDLINAVKKFQRAGIEVSAGFIVGFDQDKTTIFQRQIEFIQQSGIITAMVGLLNAPIGTRLHKRLTIENRILKRRMSGDNMDGSLNFKPKMDRDILLAGYKRILNTIYSPAHYYRRIRTFIREFHPRTSFRGHITPEEIKALFKTLWRCGIKGKEKHHFWATLVWGLFRHPTKLALIIRKSVYGFHFRKVTETV